MDFMRWMPPWETTSNLINKEWMALRAKRKVLKKLIAAVIIPVCLYVLSPCSYAGATADTSATIMRLEETTGDVKVTSASGKASQIIQKMRLNSGDDVKSAARSYAYISLDDSKVVKLDANSEATIKKNGRKFEVSLESGNLIFDVDKALGSGESFEIKSATMTMGIRGTCAQVEKKADNSTSITLLDGNLTCTVTDPKTGKSSSVEIKPGEHAELSTGDAYANGCQVVKRKASFDDLRGFSLMYLVEHSDTVRRIYQQSGMDLRNLTMQRAAERLALDENGGSVSINDGRTSPTADWYYGGH